jgi:hypothetical protein
MVFIGGPRQVGKTTLAMLLTQRHSTSTYLNWDNRTHRERILREEWDPDSEILVFDELHKYDRWKGLIKGIWDTRQRGERIIVTGSSRLDTYRRGGDSLLGRYHAYRLHPFSLAELEGGRETEYTNYPTELKFGKADTDHIQHLMAYGGFPEPCLSGSSRTHRRWLQERFERVFREDIRDTTSIRSLSQIELLGAMMPKRVGSLLSLNALSEDLEISPHTVRTWMDLLCRNYYTYRVAPYHRRIERALKKAAKYYLWDWSEVKEEGARFENLIASHLLKFCHFLRDAEGVNTDLRFVRDREKREVDFVVLWDEAPWFLVECKLTAPRSHRHLVRFAERLSVKQRYCVTLSEKDDYEDRRTGVRVLPASRFLTAVV